MSLDNPCEVCRQPKGQPCVNTIKPGTPLPGRGEHYARAMPPNPKESK